MVPVSSDSLHLVCTKITTKATFVTTSKNTSVIKAITSRLRKTSFVFAVVLWPTATQLFLCVKTLVDFSSDFSSTILSTPKADLISFLSFCSSSLSLSSILSRMYFLGWTFFVCPLSPQQSQLAV